MILVSKTYWGGMPFWFRKVPADAQCESLVLRAHDLRQSRALYWTSKKFPTPKAAVLLIHPRLDFGHHYTIPRLLDAGFAVLAQSTRFLNNDTMAEHEEMVLDVDAGVRHLKERRNIARIALLGNCGGGALLAYYQAQASTPASQRIAKTPGGSPSRFDTAPLQPADAMVYIAAHKGQGKIMLDSIDASVTDENDPLSCNPELDMYDEQNGFRPAPLWTHYPKDFLARFREGQRARVKRLDDHARELIADHDEATRAAEDPAFVTQSAKAQRDILRRRAAESVMVVYRTMANPACVDNSIDPSPRDYGSLLSERPDLMNYTALGLARTLTPRAWLSTWSGLSSNADLAGNVAKITQPSLMVTPDMDREVFLSDCQTVGDAMASTDKTIKTLNARHYFEPDLGVKETPDIDRLMDIVVPWLHERL